MSVVFVTVGTTSFDDLIAAVCSEPVTSALRELGYSKLVVQYGRGEVQPSLPESAALELEAYRYKPSLQPDFEDADLVISHAGQGSLMEALALKKRVVAVINESLMENHQSEIADELQLRRHIFKCTPAKLAATLQETRGETLEPLPPPEAQRYAQFIDNLMGF